MVYAAPPLRARPPLRIDISEVELLAADVCLAARGGLSGGEGIPELASGTPINPASPGSRVMEALDNRGARVHSIAAGADIGVHGVVVLFVVTTTITVTITG